VGGAQKGVGARGQATWPGFLACVRAGPRQFAGKAELTGRSHGAERGSGVCGGTARCVDEAGPRCREGTGARRRRWLAPTNRPHWEEGGVRERAREETVADRWSPPVWRRRRARPYWLDWAGWAESGFSFFQGFSKSFSFYFL
jgi:hypothetical protein